MVKWSKKINIRFHSQILRRTKSFPLFTLRTKKVLSVQYFSMHTVQDFFFIKKYHNCLNNSLSSLKFIFYIFSKKFIIHFYNNLGGYYVYRMLKITLFKYNFSEKLSVERKRRRFKNL